MFRTLLINNDARWGGFALALRNHASDLYRAEENVEVWDLVKTDGESDVPIWGNWPRFLAATPQVAKPELEAYLRELGDETSEQGAVVIVYGHPGDVAVETSETALRATDLARIKINQRKRQDISAKFWTIAVFRDGADDQVALKTAEDIVADRLFDTVIFTHPGKSGALGNNVPQDMFALRIVLDMARDAAGWEAFKVKPGNSGPRMFALNIGPGMESPAKRLNALITYLIGVQGKQGAEAGHHGSVDKLEKTIDDLLDSITATKLVAPQPDLFQPKRYSEPPQNPAPPEADHWWQECDQSINDDYETRRSRLAGEMTALDILLASREVDIFERINDVSMLNLGFGDETRVRAKSIAEKVTQRRTEYVRECGRRRAVIEKLLRAEAGVAQGNVNETDFDPQRLKEHEKWKALQIAYPHIWANAVLGKRFWLASIIIIALTWLQIVAQNWQQQTAPVNWLEVLIFGDQHWQWQAGMLLGPASLIAVSGLLIARHFRRKIALAREGLIAGRDTYLSRLRAVADHALGYENISVAAARIALIERRLIDLVEAVDLTKFKEQTKTIEIKDAADKLDQKTRLNADSEGKEYIANKPVKEWIQTLLDKFLSNVPDDHITIESGAAHEVNYRMKSKLKCSRIALEPVFSDTRTGS